MKQVLIATLLLCLTNSVISQDTISTDTKKHFLESSQTKLSPSQIISNFRCSEESWLRYKNSSDPVLFESAFNLNVFDYFTLNEKYDSDLKKEFFKKTTEYTTLLDSLKKIKSDFINSIYYEKDFKNPGGESFLTKSINLRQQGYQVKYDIQKKGFFISIGIVLPYTCSRNFCPKILNDIEFKQLTITKKYNLLEGKNCYTQYLFLPMDESTALEVENNRNQIEILRVFNITGVYIATFSDPDFIADNFGKIGKVQVVKGGSMRLLIYNKETEQIYFDKLYPAVTISKK